MFIFASVMSFNSLSDLKCSLVRTSIALFSRSGERPRMVYLSDLDINNESVRNLVLHKISFTGNLVSQAG